MHHPLPTNINVLSACARSFHMAVRPALNPMRPHARAVCSSYPRSDLVIQTHAEEDFIKTSHIYGERDAAVFNSNWF
jgi:hypothetical protein